MRSLELLATGLVGRPVQVQALAPTTSTTGTPDSQQEQPAASPRPVLTATHLLLPPACMALDTPAGLRTARAAIAHAVAHLRYSTGGQASGKLKPMAVAVMSAVEDARVEQLLLREHPGMRAWFVPSLEESLEPTVLGAAGLISRMDLALANPAYRDGSHWVNKARDLFTAETDLADYAAFRRIASILANDLGQMRVPFRAQLYTVPARYRDDNSYLWTHDAPDTPPPPSVELAVAHRLPRPASVSARSSATDVIEVGPAEIELARTLHPEWNQASGHMRPDWCTVIDKLPAWQLARGMEAAGAAHARTATLALRTAGRVDRARRLRRQWEGPDIDLDAAIACRVDRRMRRASEPRIFMRAPDGKRHASILVLLDLSESTNDTVGESHRSLLHVEKEAALILAHAASPAGERIAIHGFSSNTRDEVSYYRLLEFGIALNEHTRAMVQSAPGRHSTRMGAALRHATACLEGEPNDLRAILLVSDGAPSDVDVADARYLREDARVAVLQARNRGVQVHCLAVDPRADGYVRRIFGWQGYQIVDDSMVLAARLQAACQRLTHA